MGRLTRAGSLALLLAACGQTKSDGTGGSSGSAGSGGSGATGGDASSCLDVSSKCSADNECCSGACAEESEVCLEPGPCSAIGSSCTSAFTCCTGRCFNGKCAAPCIKTGEPCGFTPGVCCSGLGCSGVCG